MSLSVLSFFIEVNEMPVFGMPTLIETDTLDACAALCRELELCFIELNMNLPQFQLDAIQPSLLKEIAKKYGIFYTIHLPENLDVSDFNPYIADAYRRTVKETILLAKELGIPILNMHLSLGVYFTLPDQRIYLFSAYKERYLKTIAAFRQMCEEAVGNSDITICIENCDGFPDFQKEALDILLQSPVFALTFDVGHSHACGGADEAYILQRKARMRHMHLHDASKKGAHLPLGSGELACEDYLALAQERRCRIVLETKTIIGLKRSVEWLHKNGWFPI